MFASTSLLSMTAFLLVFSGTCLLGFVLFVRSYGDRRRAVERLRDLADGEMPAPTEKSSLAELAWSTLPKLGTLLLPREESGLAHRKQQLLQAGFFSSNALRNFMGVTVVLMLIFPVVFVLIPYALGFLALRWALAACLLANSAGMLAPNIWLRSRVKTRQRLLLQGLPDALDMLVMCLEGGVSLMAAVQRVTGELQTVHPVLSMELNIVVREIQLGLSAGEALKKMGDRCGLADVRNLASILLQSERYGASLVKALRTHSDSWRQERQNQAEEIAQKAAVKILFPTLLCIFPAIFIVLLGPAAFQLADLFGK
jgi:tight adherence protein C